jgi:DNA-binding transcriptional LysR family regulator
MDLRQLEYLVAVAEEANFTRAAERVHISQSGVSAQIRQLERELGAELVDRSGRVATLTPAGAAALTHARAALASADAVRRAVDDVTGLVRGRLTVGMVTASRITPLFDALSRFHDDHPGVEVALAEDDSHRLIEDVGRGAIDVALVATAGDPPDVVESRVLRREGLVIGVPDGHALATRKRLRTADLQGHPVVCLPAGTGIRAAFDRACDAHDVELHIAFEASAPDTVADLAVRGLGAAILSESPASDNADRLRVVPIRDAPVPIVLSLVWSRGRNPARDAFLRAIRPL